MNSRQTTEKLARELCSVRQKKISQLKTRIDSGKYRVKTSTIAKALLMAR